MSKSVENFISSWEFQVCGAFIQITTNTRESILQREKPICKTIGKLHQPMSYRADRAAPSVLQVKFISNFESFQLHIK